MPRQRPGHGGARSHGPGDSGDIGTARPETGWVGIPGRDHLHVDIGGGAAIAYQRVAAVQRPLDHLPLVDQKLGAARLDPLAVTGIGREPRSPIVAVVCGIEGVGEIEEPLVVERAVGARRIDIRRQFMIEAFSISLLGGVTGVVVGVAIARLVALSAGWPTVVTLTSILLSTSVSIAVGLVSGLYPAMRAAELDPIDALRYE